MATSVIGYVYDENGFAGEECYKILLFNLEKFTKVVTHIFSIGKVEFLDL